MSQDKAQVIELLPHATVGSIPTLDIGATVCVRNRFLGNWSSGFVVAEVLHHGYRIRRISDGMGFPDVFPVEDVRMERRRDPERGILGSYLDRGH
jgi:hypothetical protein